MLLSSSAMEHMLRFTLNDISGILGLLVVLFALSDNILKSISRIKAPGKELQERVEKLEEEIGKHRGYLKHDNEKLESNDETERLILWILLALLEDADSVKRAELKKKINKFLINNGLR